MTTKINLRAFFILRLDVSLRSIACQRRLNNIFPDGKIWIIVRRPILDGGKLGRHLNGKFEARINRGHLKLNHILLKTIKTHLNLSLN